MPRYTIENARTYIGGKLCEIGEIVDYVGWPGSTLKAVDSVAARVKSFFDEANERGRKIPRVPDLAKFADPVEEPAPAPQAAPKPPGKFKPGTTRRAPPVKPADQETDGHG